MLSKTYQLRPHLLSIIFILLTILVFERKRLYWTLPPIALLWANLHGVEWVVGGVIAFAYIVESVIRRLRDPSQPIPLQPVTWSVLAALALIVNPAGLQLFLPALDNNPDFQKFVQEMQPVQLGFLVSPSLSRLSISPVTAAPIAGFLSLLAWLSLAVGHRLRISHAIMSVAGLILLVQGVRFFAEWALLSLPMLSSFVAAWANRAASWVPSQPWLRTVLAGWIVAMPVFSFPSNGLVVGQLPFQSAGLPTGISDFLLANNATGKLLAPPGLAGYFAWTLYPGIRIFSDMKHHDIATFYNLSAIRNEHALKRVLDIHAPDFVAVTIGDKALENRLRSNGKFEAVFFDDQFVLYSDAARHPELEGVSFRALDPHTLTFKDSDRAQAIAELNRVADQDPRGRRVRQALWRLSYNEKDYAAAERQAEAILIAHPGDPNALFMRASTLEQSGRHREALAIFSGIFPFLSADSKRSVRRHQGSCYYLDQDFGRAYAAFHEGINPYRDEVEPEYLFQYAFVAAIEGEPREAKRALEMLFFLIDPKDANLHQKATELLRTIQSNEFEDIGWF